MKNGTCAGHACFDEFTSRQQHLSTSFILTSTSFYMKQILFEESAGGFCRKRNGATQYRSDSCETAQDARNAIDSNCSMDSSKLLGQTRAYVQMKTMKWKIRSIQEASCSFLALCQFSSGMRYMEYLTSTSCWLMSPHQIIYLLLTGYATTTNVTLYGIGPWY